MISGQFLIFRSFYKTNFNILDGLPPQKLLIINALAVRRTGCCNEISKVPHQFRTWVSAMQNDWPYDPMLPSAGCGRQTSNETLSNELSALKNSLSNKFNRLISLIDSEPPLGSH
jgi:hypothetical protein